MRWRVCGKRRCFVWKIQYVSSNIKGFLSFSQFKLLRMLNQFDNFTFNWITVEPEPIIGCEDNDDCSSYEACRNQDCVNPCVIPRNPCSNPATCSVNNHQPICACPPGYEENAYGQCTPGIHYQNSQISRNNNKLISSICCLRILTNLISSFQLKKENVIMTLNVLMTKHVLSTVVELSLIHIWRCRRYAVCRSRWSPYH